VFAHTPSTPFTQCMNKPSVLVVTRNLPPLVGGMERLIWHVVDTLRSHYTVHVVGPLGCRFSLSADVHVVEVGAKSVLLFLLKATLAALWSAIRHRPVIVFAGSGLLAPVVWPIARITKSRCAVYLHGLDIQVAHTVYQTFWVPFFRYFDCVLVNSRFTKKLALGVGVVPDRIKIVHPGVELPNFADAAVRSQSFRSRHNLGQRPILLFVGRITERKGLACFVEHIFPFISLEVPDVVLLVLGGSPVDALQGGKNAIQRVETILKENGLGKRTIFLGQCSDQELGDAYFSANILVFPVQESEFDIEGFGMVALEAAAHGLPTVAFAVGGVPDAVSNGCSGKLIPPGCNMSFVQAVVELLHENAGVEKVVRCRRFAQEFEWGKFGQKITRLFRNLVQNEI